MEFMGHHHTEQYSHYRSDKRRSEGKRKLTQRKKG